MVKRIKFPLEMANGVQVRSLDELQENFDLEKIIGYYMNGKLLVWLKDRYYDDKAEEILALDRSDKDFKKKICNVFGIKCTDSKNIDITRLEERSKRIFELKKYTDDKNVIDNVDKVAFTQEEMDSLLYENVNTVYLCGKQFVIPLNKENVTYVGINNPIVIIKSSTVVDFLKKNILLNGVSYNEEYMSVLENAILKRNEMENRPTSLHYKASGLFNSMVKNSYKNASPRLFDEISDKLLKFNYDIDKKTRNSVDIIKNANLSEAFDNYLDRIS
ncbi:hypothetical protein ACJDT4_10985 [Clostridium neuense]|uniref:Uncharacterized protein n=1 Tax=Clostridium neuense TaxID=1728934 RepID=A0ABW8TET2_9CLOT